MTNTGASENETGAFALASENHQEILISWDAKNFVLEHHRHAASPRNGPIYGRFVRHDNGGDFLDAAARRWFPEEMPTIRLTNREKAEQDLNTHFVCETSWPKAKR